MHRGRDDPADAESDGAGQDRGRHIALLDDLLPQVEWRDFGQRAEGGDEQAYAQTREDQGVHDGNISHSARIKYVSEERGWPSGWASAFQADLHGFESRTPLHLNVTSG